ncbi:hypothetical protein DV096_20530 [Bradymonadaceae bacterium TMQ3]|nr:hypothetical protein DV096_20530 [Bradymonadaceae bacterium TMQ3]
MANEPRSRTSAIEHCAIAHTLSDTPVRLPVPPLLIIVRAIDAPPQIPGVSHLTPYLLLSPQSES